MPGLLATLEELFDTKDLYQVLGIEKTADESKVKKAYHKTSLLVHPDRVKSKDRELATKKFQALGAVYKILSDKDSRALYDESGEVDDEGDASLNDRDWSEYWRVLFKQVTLKDIKEFEKKYRHSDEEAEDLKKAYMESEGDMDAIIDTVLCATDEDEPRFAEMLIGWIKEGKVPDFDKFSHETKENKNKRKAKREEEAKEAEEYAKEIGLGSSDESLANMIMQRQQRRQADADSFFDHLASKYGKKETKAKKKTSKK